MSAKTAKKGRVYQSAKTRQRQGMAGIVQRENAPAPVKELRWKLVTEYQEFELEEGCCVTKFKVDVVYYCTVLLPMCFHGYVFITKLF
jgi:hypothetical protein